MEKALQSNSQDTSIDIDSQQYYNITRHRITLWSPIHLSPLQNLRKQIGFAIAILYWYATLHCFIYRYQFRREYAIRSRFFRLQIAVVLSDVQ